MSELLDKLPEPGAATSWRVEHPEQVGVFLNEQIHDDLMHTAAQLAAELWVVKRRLRELEGHLVASGAVSDLDEQPREPTYTFEREERDAFIARVFGHLAHAGNPDTAAGD